MSKAVGVLFDNDKIIVFSDFYMFLCQENDIENNNEIFNFYEIFNCLYYIVNGLRGTFNDEAKLSILLYIFSFAVNLSRPEENDFYNLRLTPEDIFMEIKKGKFQEKLCLHTSKKEGNKKTKEIIKIWDRFLKIAGRK